MPEWPSTSSPVVETLQEQLRSEQESNLMLSERIADLQLAMEDKGWQSLASGVADELSAEGRRRIALICRTMAVSNPLIKRALGIRAGYVWGQGVEVTARIDDEKDDTVVELVNQLLTDFAEDNDGSLTGSKASEELERALGTDGQVYLALFTSPLTGRVQVRSTPTDEIVDIITNPEDRDEPWFYVREHVVTALEAGYAGGNTRTRSTRKRTVHPALGFRPATRIRTLDRAEVRWDAPIIHVPVNRLDGWKYGIPDAYASVAWARMYRDFLVDWAGLTKALSKIAFQTSADTNSRAQKAAAAVQAMPDVAGQAAISGAGIRLEAVSKSGATIDADSGKPLAGMAAAGLGLPVTMVLSDPGSTGARAVAETLDRPLILEMGMRRLLWQNARERILRHVIASSVEAPRGRLKGKTRIDDWGRKRTYLLSGAEPILEWVWPPLADLDPVALVSAIVQADGTQKLPPLTTARLLLGVLGVKDVDDVLRQMTDENGNWIDPLGSSGDALVQRARAGREPVPTAGDRTAEPETDPEDES